MSGIFYGCNSLLALDISSFNTSNVTDMSHMFGACFKLSELNLVNFNTANVVDMSYMFFDCADLIKLNVSKFNTDNVININHMFEACEDLEELDLSSFNLQNVSDATAMFVEDIPLISWTYKLTLLHTPCNLSETVKLPSNTGDIWYRSDGTSVTELPQNLSYSVALGKNYIPEEKEIIPSIEDIEITKDKLTIAVYDEDTKAGIEGAVVTVNNISYLTSKNGLALVDASDEKVRTEITVIAESYENSTTACEASNGMIIHIPMIPKSDTLRVTELIADMDGQKIDLLREKVVLGYYEDLSKLSNRQASTFTFTAKTNHETLLYELLAEDDTVVIQNTSGTFTIPTAKGGTTEDGGEIKASMPLESLLKQGKYKLRVTDGSDQTTTIGIGLTCTVNYLTAEREKISGKFALGNAFEVQIPDDVPLIGGGTYKFGLEDKLPVDISIDGDGKLKVAFNKPADTDFNQYKDNYNRLSKKAKSASQLASKFGHVKGFNAGYFDIDGSICGYGEGNISELNEGNITVKVGVIATLEGTGGVKQYFMAGFVPINIFVEGEASVSADLNASIPIKNWEITGFDLTGGTLSGKVGLTAGAGVGVGIEVNVSLNGNANYTWMPAKKYQKAWLEASGKVELVLLFYEKPLWESPKYTYTMMEKGSKTRSTAETFTNSQQSDFVPLNRSYLDYSDGFLKTMSAAINSSDSSTQTTDGKTIIKSAIYPSASPIMTRVGNTTYLFWVEDIASRSANNIGAIVYATSQDNVSWSEPKRLIAETEDATLDGAFTLFASGQKIYITWQDGTKILEDNETMLDALQSMSIRRAILDTQTGEVTVEEPLTQESGYYMYPCTIAQNNTRYTTYVHNALDSGDLFGNNTQNLYIIADTDTEPQKYILPEHGCIINMVSGIFDSTPTIVCEMDTDGDLATTEDRELYLWNMTDGSQSRLTDNAVADSMPVLSESGSIYWYQDGNIVRLQNKDETPQGIWSEPSLGAPVCFNVVTGQDNRDMLLWEMTDSNKADGAVAVYGTRENADGTWQNISKCAESQGTIVSRVNAIGDWENLTIAHLEGVFLEDGTLLKDLCVLGKKEVTDVSLDYVDFAEKQIHGGSALPLQVQITNQGNTVIDSLQFTIDDTVIQSVASLNLQPGENREITVDGFTVPSDLDGKKEFTISVVLSEDQDSLNNTQTIVLETTNYEIDTATRLDRGGTWLDFTVWNNGDLPSSGVARVHKSTEGGDVIYETDFHALSSGYGYACSIDLSSYEDSVTHYYVEALPDYAKDESSDDSQFVYIGYGTGVEEQIDADTETPVTSISLSSTELYLNPEESTQLTALADNGTALAAEELIWSSYDISTASVDNSGNITAHRNGTTYVTVTYGDLSCECIVHVGATETDIRTYTITFDTQGGDPIQRITGLQAGDVISLPKNATREGKVFLGWYTQATGGEKIDDFTITVQKSIILYAHWGEIESEDGLWISAVADQLYTGKAIKPSVRVYDGSKLLIQNQDYTISYSKNVNANDASNPNQAPTITVKGKGNYTGKETATFKILPLELTESNMIVADMTKVYNQKIQQPIPSITINGRKLKYKTDFSIEYPDYASGSYKDIGTYRIIVIGKGNYTGEQTLTFDITDKILISKVSVAKIPNQAYTGGALMPAPVVKYKKAVLVEHEDYELEYRDNTAIGKAAVILKGKGSYAGQKTVSFQITGGSIKKAKVAGLVSPITYTGEEIRQNCVLTIKVNGEDITLQSGKDYTVTYQKNTNAGTAKVIFKGINGYTGTLQKSYKITPYDILQDSGSHITYTKDIVCTYVKGGSRPEPDLYFKGILLKKGTDYTLNYKNNNVIQSNKTPTIVVKGKGSFKNKLEIPFTIHAQNLANMTLAPCDKVYKNKSNIYKIVPKLLDTNGKALQAGKDFDKKSITYTYANDVALENGTSKKAGDAVEKTDIIPANTRICVTLASGSGNLYQGVFSGTYRIVAADIKSAKVSIPVQTYTGREIRPDKTEIVVRHPDAILSDDDYEIVSYANNIKKGNASVTLAGKGNYGGTKTVKFKIKAKGFWWWWR
ncbi:MAG: BspA family leucine-rich repeat surface protein [Bacteroidales bacterium]|nr:BspA family leucine-rich repeat surface protein [Bacteroidales bacterium]